VLVSLDTERLDYTPELGGTQFVISALTAGDANAKVNKPLLSTEISTA
jgi:hypothetical protein